MKRSPLRKQKLPSQTEHQIQTACINYLKYKGWYVQRMNSGKVPVINKYGKRHLIQLNEVGTPDIMAFKRTHISHTANVRLVYIEVKRQGNEPTEAQIYKMNELEEKGAECHVVHSLEQLEELGF